MTDTTTRTTSISEEMRDLIFDLIYSVTANDGDELGLRRDDLESAIADLERDAALGRAVRGMEEGEILIHRNHPDGKPFWNLFGDMQISVDTSLRHGNTPEAALGLEDETK